tara:strand:+ start:388 stop:1083 length:696 start_codon:yes stop_codon:yes gene_type:complete
MIEYCEYNPYSLTGRPSNHYNQVNYAALNKEDGTRKRFISRHKEKGGLLEVDLSGFHLYLLYLICGLDFPEDVYLELSKHYPKDVNPKDHTFKQIYGGIHKDLLDIEPFSSINALAQSIYDKFMAGTLKSLLFERPIATDLIEGSNQTKIFNYMLQNLETEFNSLIITELLQGLRETNTKLILYTYDSFLFDVNIDERDLIIDLIKKVFKEIPYKVKIGKDYQNMKTIKLP